MLFFSINKLPEFKPFDRSVIFVFSGGFDAVLFPFDCVIVDHYPTPFHGFC